MRRNRDRTLLSVLGLLTFIWVVIRAHVQSVTIDEADTYMLWAARSTPYHWWSASNNHVLNSALIHLSTLVFGLWHLSLRLPALIGAAIYISGAVALCLSLQSRLRDRLILYALLTLNPMTLDYLVAARGYGMACGFLLWALWLLLNDRTRLTTVARAGALSGCIALCFASSFAFAWVCFAVFLAAAIRWRSAGVRTWMALVLPAAVLSLFLSGYTAENMPRTQLWFGTKSMGRTFGTVFQSFITEPNPGLLNPWLLPVFQRGGPYLGPLLLAGLSGSLVFLFMERKGNPERTRLLATCLGILAFTITMHYAAYRITGVLLPKERTAVFILPLAMLIFSLSSTVILQDRVARIWQTAFRCVLATTAVYVLFCLRLTWFAEWRWNADTRQAYDHAAWWAHEKHVETVPSSWHFAPSLNFYNLMDGHEKIAFRNKDEMKDVRSDVYVLFKMFDQQFIDRQQLQIVWESDTGPVVAVRREKF